MSTTAVDYDAERKALRVRWITPADEAHIAAEVRKHAFSFDDEKAITCKIGAAVDQAARDLDRTYELVEWKAHALYFLTDSNLTVSPRHSHRTLPLSAYNEKVEQVLAEREAEADEQYPVDAEEHALVRQWLGVTPYTVYRFFKHVTDSAADAARDIASELLFDRDDRSVQKATEKAAIDWLAKWRKGLVA